ncbi:TlpA disulfide reductase family protein [Paenibacillus sp. YPG26]|uniref:TlpA family protein disulfide reductase n=1 Tax=Paenibacillus sp. YPG26 TaxID=2878915 RepID=UPI002040CA6D|nr:TlpA disulfide reductase family protein [Paenibacillus sp. YPG26]USB32221.1 TlpA family protein disulfide reductase [Paenibacillus sp. YPG26]
MRRNGFILLGIALLLGVALYQNLDKGGLSLFGSADKQQPSLSATALAKSGLKPGAAAPSFTLTGLDGKTYQVGGKRDKPMLVNFWASWCDPCKEEAPDLVRMADKYSQSLDIYSVNVTMYDQLSKVKEFVQQYKINFPVLLDEKEAAYRMYNGVAFPTNVLIDRDGVIQDIIIGTVSAEQLEQKLADLVEM